MIKNTERIRSLTEIAILCALMCVSAMVCIPLPVPITLQTLVLYTSLFAFGGRKTAFVTLLYIAIGSFGLPVFSGFSGGISRLFDATGGFVFGMLAASVLWWIAERALRIKKAAEIILSAVSLAVIYLIGSVWYYAVYLGSDGGFFAALAVSVLPFVVPDAVKIVIAYIIAKRVTKAFRSKM